MEVESSVSPFALFVSSPPCLPSPLAKNVTAVSLEFPFGRGNRFFALPPGFASIFFFIPSAARSMHFLREKLSLESLEFCGPVWT